MKHAKIPLVTAGGDWAGVMNIHAGRVGNGVAHHGVEQTRARLRLASIMFVLVFAVLAGRLAQLTLAEDPQLARVGTTDRETDVQRPAITDRNGVVLASQIYLTTLGANASEIQNGDAVAAQLTEILPNMNAQRARRLLAGDRHYVELGKGLTPLQKRACLSLETRAETAARSPARLPQRVCCLACGRVFQYRYARFDGTGAASGRAGANVTHI